MNELTPYEFDQTDKGWVLFDREGKYIEAVKAIESYINSNEDKIANQNEVSIQTLFFHAGQEYAMEDEKYYSQAIEMMQKSRKPSESWNVYVDGSIAFLSKDQPRLEVCTNKLAELANANEELVANANILRAFLDGMVNNLTYASIYDTIAKE